MHISDYIKQKGLTQLQAAKLLGVSQSAISHFCTGRRMPRRKTALEIQERSNGEITAAALLGLDQSRNS